MVNYISQYKALVQNVHGSDWYKNAKPKKKHAIDKLLNEEDIKNYFGKRVVPQLTLHESLVLGFANSDALHKRTSDEQKKVIGYVKSSSFKHVVDNLEARIQKPFCDLGLQTY